MSIQADIMARLSPAVLVALFDAGVSLGLGIAPETEPPASAEVAQLISAVRSRWFGELEAARQWRRATPPTAAVDVPAWLRAAQERQAIADAPPPEGWGVAGWPI